MDTNDLIGVSCFFDFLCAIFSRIAYEETPRPLYLLSRIFDDIIPKELIEALSKITNISELNDDKALLKNLDPNNKIKIRKYNNTEDYVDFIEYAKKINELIEGYKRYECYTFPTSPDIILEAIATSNYGNVLIIGVKTMPNFVFTAFRGTYSAKTAASYTRPSSLVPVEISPNTKILGGIGKILFEMLNTILQANKYIAKKLLEPNNRKPVIPVFTGHSLGGGMATILDYEFCKEGPKIIVLTEEEKKILAVDPICITFGAPRVLSKTTSENLCNLITKNNNFRRYSNDGDPVTALPSVNYYHPCSSQNDKAKGRREKVSRDCKSSTKKTSSLMKQLPSDYKLSNITYDLPHAYSEPTKAIKCTNDNKGPGLGTKLLNFAPNMFDHMTYLYVSFARAATITDLVTSAVGSKEVSRVERDDKILNVTKGDTIMTITDMDGDGSVGTFPRAAIDLVKIRHQFGDKALMIDKDMNTDLFEFSKNGKFNIAKPKMFKQILTGTANTNYLQNLKKESNTLETIFKDVDNTALLNLSEYEEMLKKNPPPKGQSFEEFKEQMDPAEDAAKDAEAAAKDAEAAAKEAKQQAYADRMAEEEGRWSAYLQKVAEEKKTAREAAEQNKSPPESGGRNNTKRSRNKTKRSRNKTKKSRNKTKKSRNKTKRSRNKK